MTARSIPRISDFYDASFEVAGLDGRVMGTQRLGPGADPAGRRAPDAPREGEKAAGPACLSERGCRMSRDDAGKPQAHRYLAGLPTVSVESRLYWTAPGRDACIISPRLM